MTALRLPDWPLLMDQPTLQRYLSLTRRQLKAYLAAGLVPPAREHLPGQLRWHRGEVDASIARAWGMRQAEEPGDAIREAKQRLEGLAGPARLRPGRAGGQRRDLPLLPPQRPANPPSRP
jgi:hypothetical protein